MYGFRPARNRKHPGDPPPRWAPLGRHGRIVILVTVIAGIVIALLVIGSKPVDAWLPIAETLEFLPKEQ